ncbi:PAP2-domain-containing protein [Suhomyces tanzawaensis NRRL Y-17324]|uniref:PAP2-domain-containing protein n=1 Tax=Suhomyces tanzawaensis NRRL Y-17324 TaxID=984487 RepID=A0A1E4SDG7_9ASCO|nr:PAP2-domain-containing protein [Suhomyces tanzawaensis NRRL Y-17324]ODV77559.1 PAP2-domain-containing protein [Suhomyces tanzawaensis NRRL Y-17324]
MSIFSPLIFLFHFLYRTFWSGLNQRSVVGLVVNFWINFAPVFTWLMIFKNAGLIPKKIRPPIHVKLAATLDDYMFNISKPLGSLCSLVAIVIGTVLVYLKWYRMSRRVVRDARFEFFTPLTHQQISAQTSATNNKILANFKKTGNYMPYNCWYLAPVALSGASWFLLNFDYWLHKPLATHRDLLAWFSYVLGHFFAPLFTAIWLYVFHAPGALKLFSFALGMQNIAGVITHLLFPNAPPWFIHLKGMDATADYDTPGYAAGLTRVDMAMGTHMHSNGFHASPIVFGALPSLHSAMAVMVFFFLSYYSRWTALKVVGLCFVVLQWWATIYLDHHWRLDLIAGMFYSITSFTILWCWKGGFQRVDHDFVVARLSYNFAKGSTMGMRVFRGTSWQKFFDPLS